MTGTLTASDEAVHDPRVQAIVRALMAAFVAVYSLYVCDLPTACPVLNEVLGPGNRVGLAASYCLGHLLIYVRVHRRGWCPLWIEAGIWLDTGAALATWAIDPNEPGPMMLLVIVAAIGNGIQHSERYFGHILWGTAVGTTLVAAARGWVLGLNIVTAGVVILGFYLLTYTFFLVRRLERVTLLSQERSREAIAATEQARQANQRLLLLEKAVETTRTGITIKDCAGKVLYVNRADVVMHGYDDPEELVGGDASTFGLPESRSPLTMEQLESTGGWARESTNVRKDGSRFAVYLISDIIREEKGSPMGLVTVCEDLTELKKTESKLRDTHGKLQQATTQLIQTEKLAALGELAAEIAHEINQPLNGIKLIAQSISRYIDTYDKEQLGEELAEVEQLVRSMTQTVERLSIFTRRSSEMSVRSVDLVEVVEHAVALVSQHLEHCGVSLVREIDESLPRIQGDQLRLEQALLNLLLNARNALDGARTDDKRVAIRLYSSSQREEAESVVIEVEDNGVGIAKEMQERIFRSFFTTSEPGKGTGLGLSITRKTIQEHNGRIEVESEPGRGSLFRITLPVGQ